MTELHTVSEVAMALRVHHQTVRAWIRSGRVPAIRTPGGIGLRVTAQVLNRLLSEAPDTEKNEGS